MTYINQRGISTEETTTPWSGLSLKLSGTVWDAEILGLLVWSWAGIGFLECKTPYFRFLSDFKEVLQCLGSSVFCIVLNSPECFIFQC